MDRWRGKEYADRCIKFRKDIGAESHPVITREKHPQQWCDWDAYYGFRGMIASQQMMRERDEKTVPAISPFDFDPEFSLPFAAAEVPRAVSNPNYAPPTPEEEQKACRLMPNFHGRKMEVATENEGPAKLDSIHPYHLKAKRSA